MSRADPSTGAPAPATEMAHALETPERVAVDFEVAGLGYRAMAFLVDAGILLAGWTVLLFLAGLLTRGAYLGYLSEAGGVVQALVVVAFFLLNWGYALLFEWRWDGQTPGKRLVGIRVMRLDGRPYDFLTAAVRNLMRAIDGFPVGTYAVGLLSVFLTRDGRRLGDLAAGTVLVRDDAVDLSLYTEDPAAEPSAGAALALPAQVAKLSAEAYELVRSFEVRAEHLTPEARRRVACTTAASVGRLLGLPEARIRVLEQEAGEAERFIAQVSRAARVRGGGGRESAAAVAGFVRERHAGWEALDAALKEVESGVRLDPDALAALDRHYRRASADLAYARTFFPGSRVTLYLNRLCGRAYRILYRRHRPPLAALHAFFWSEVPDAFWRCRHEVLVAGLVLCAGGLLGTVLTAADPEVATLVLGEEAVQGLAEGRLWTDGLIAVVPPSVLGARIFTNNISVAFTAFAGGLSAGLWTLFLMALNGALLGIAFTAAAQHGLAPRLLDFVAAHGPVELSVIVLAGAAGLRVGGALLSPGRLRRVDALKLRGRDGVRLALGGAPWLVVVGLVEGFVSPAAFLPTWLKGAVGLLLGLLLWTYLLRLGARGRGAPAAVG